MSGVEPDRSEQNKGSSAPDADRIGLIGCVRSDDEQIDLGFGRYGKMIRGRWLEGRRELGRPILLPERL